MGRKEITSHFSRKAPIIPDAIINELLSGTDPNSIFDPNGLLDHLKKAFSKRVLNAELDYHLDEDEEAANSRNGYGRKTVTTDTGEIELSVPRDRSGVRDQRLWHKIDGVI